MNKLILMIMLIVSFGFLTAEEKNIMIPDSFLNLYFNPQNEWTVFVAELSTQQALLVSFRKDPVDLKIIKEFPISSGKQRGSKRSEWDLRTPEGFYQITQIRSQNTLQEKFGTGAFILDYPNSLDRTLRKSGSAIWIHGTDRMIFIDYDSEGCIRLRNEDILFLMKYLKPNQTPVFIVDQIEWLSIEEILHKKNGWEDRFNIWIDSQNHRNFSLYIKLYHPTFFAPLLKKDIGRWTLLQRDRFQQNQPVNLSFDDLKIIYQNGYLLMQGKEESRSAGEIEFIRKSILWQLIDKEWFIVLEENLSG